MVKCIYAPNPDMNLTGPQKVFDDTNENNFTHKISTGDFNVALNHFYDTSGYLHINNPNSRDYLARNIEKCNLVDIWRSKNPKSRQYTFGKKQAKNYTRARLDYFLISKNSTHLVSKIGMDRVSNLSDHRPIHLHMSFSSVQRGNRFWRFNNELLKDLKYIQGCNEIITSTLLNTLNNLGPLKSTENSPERILLMLTLSLTSARLSYMMWC